MAQRKLNSSVKPGRSRAAALTITHPNAAGVDIGSAAHFVAVPPDRADEPVREFPSFTDDLHAKADWLKACGVDTVAMESTGVYWIPLYELLEPRGFTVLLVSARHVKNVSGRKSDVLEASRQRARGGGLLIPLAFVQAWSQRAPWPDLRQVEQDLIIARSLCDLFSSPALRDRIAFRGGTAINKLLFKQPLRYSEDIDLVQTRAEPIGQTVDAVREALSWLGKPKRQQAQHSMHLVFLA